MIDRMPNATLHFLDQDLVAFCLEKAEHAAMVLHSVTIVLQSQGNLLLEKLFIEKELFFLGFDDFA